MKSKLVFCLIIVLALISISAVSASEDNATGSVELIQDNDTVAVAEDVQVAEESDEILEVDDASKINSTISSQNAVGYENFKTKIVVKLTANNKNLASKPVNVTVDDVLYRRITNGDGQIILTFKLTKGTYDVSFAYGGDENTTACNGTSKITVKDAIKTKMVIYDKYMNYRQGLKNPFIVRLLDAKGNALKNQKVTFRFNGRSYVVTTNGYGYAQVALNLKKGNYRVYYTFNSNAPYLYSSGSFLVKVKAPMAKGNGYWLWPMHMKSLNLKLLSQRGTKHVFLHAEAISAYGKSAVLSWIAKAHKYGIKVHLWMNVCSNGEDWVSPVNKDNTFKYWFINKKVREALSYAKMPGVDGVHLDYIRFGGTAHNYKTATQAINYIVKKTCVYIHNARPNCIVSAAVMPEVSMMKYWYGQDISTMGRYLDVIVPMVYKGNFGQKTTWITQVVKTYKDQSKSAVIWAGLQTYHSDNNVNPLSYKELLKDAKSAKAGGATGSILFRVGLTRYLNFNSV